ncbi:bifunctional chitinase/lysozyme [Spiroplasma litorale]|uniref:Bifunctional chitinase/lysozyme n=1 Tax=Spiroplasma litorale TaxID=216942 RepID=A0A0K1W1I6_9MOLU|nr:hypothetical protein [Spiroplasma litorale]AKX34185.1 bifunctional chitinase/lysozyme [Spiroplasma litorale]
MKKLISLLSSFMIVTPLAGIITSCSIGSDKDKNSSFDPSQDEPIDFKNPYAETGTSEKTETNLMKARDMKWASVLTNDYSNSSRYRSLSNVDNRAESTNTQSTLAKKDVLKNNLKSKIGFNPYSDIGIVEDSQEYLLKNKGLGSSYKEHAKFEGNSTAENNHYNNLGELWNNSDLFKDKENDGITLGFMQNASDENELVPMWDAAPNKTSNNSAEWFQQRWDKWTTGDKKLDSSKVTISFGPFANSLWHEAYKNGYTEEQLADKLAEISVKYGTKKFDFYFAAPYLTNKGSYADSQRLLAGALKILLEKDNEFDIRLSLVVSTKDGISSVIARPNGNWDGDISLIGSEEFPLYMFTKFLGMNFRLNLVLPYLTYSAYNEVGGDKDWEMKVIKSATEDTEKTWRTINDKLNGNTSKFLNDSGNVYDRMVLTPWIGKRAEKAIYDFDANDALEFRKFAEDKKVGQISMFYITRDYPSEFMSNGLGPDGIADKNALDQNIRSASGYDKFTYSKILNGTMKTDIPEEAKTPEAISKLDGYLNYDRDIRNNHSLDEYQKEGWDGVAGGNGNEWNQGQPSEGEGNVVNPSTPSTSNKNVYVKWEDANPNRKDNIVDKNESNNSTYFSPYLDAGLYEGNDIAKIRENTGLDHLTLAFVQQVNSHNNSLDLSIAGIENKGDGYAWWEKSQLYEKDLKPLVDSNNFENIKVAYGGATTGGFIEKNPWNLAYKLANNDINKASDLLSDALFNYNDYLKNFASKSSGKTLNMPKNIDFDIEGQAQEDHISNDVLAKTLAKMKKSDSSWNFSVTLPVLPSGLTNVGFNVMDKFTKAFKNEGLSYKDMPVINLMLMDYGNGIYLDGKTNGKTNFDLAKEAIENTKENIAKSVIKNYGISTPSNRDIHRLIGATPMIGVNDTVEGVFTLEDAKELYNWAQSADLSYLSMWSMNDDRGKLSGVARPKSLTSHGLGYLGEYDFAKVFNGQWDEKVKRPAKKV